MDRPPTAVKPDALKMHRQQSAWQIWLPLALALVLVIGLCILCAFIVLGGINNPTLAKTLGPVAVLWVLIPSCLTGLIPLALLIGLVYLAAKMLGGMPGLGEKAQNAVKRVQEMVETTANKAANLVIKVGGMKVGWDQIKTGFQASKTPNKGG